MKRKKKLNINWKKLLLIFFTIFLIFSNLYLFYAVALYKSIETKIRLVGCITLGVMSLLFFTLLLKFKKKTKYKAFIIISVITLIYCSGLTFVGNKVNNIYKKIAGISSNNYDNYSASVISRKGASANDISDVKSSKVGITNDEDDYEGYTLGNKIIEENTLKNIQKYDSYNEMLNDLINGKIDYAIVPTNYDAMFSNSEGLENISQITKIIYTKNEQKEKTITTKTTKNLDEPFTILIMGVDTVSDGFSSGFNGDALILVTFNPKTTNATILSIPRDTYMPISCMKDRKNKITNAGWRGQDCIINSLENYFEIDIDYHVKINFNGVVSLVDALGGVEVDVPYSFCEQNSKRQWGKNTVFVNSGKQVLNGEQALAFARHRKVTQYMVNYCGSKYVTNANYWNDFTRGQNQQIIINALLKKLKNIDDFSKVEDILDTISKNIETDISTDNILSLYNLAKDILKKSSSQDEAFGMQKLYLSGQDARIYDYSFATNSGTKLVLYNYNVYKESKEAVISAMKQNLDLETITPVKKFSFSIKNKYEEKVIGKNIGSTSNLELMPNFIGRDVSTVENYANSNSINLSIEYTEGKAGQINGQVVSQSIPAKTDLDMLNSSRSMTITVVRNTDTTSNYNDLDNDITDEEPDTTPDDDQNDNTDNNQTSNSNTPTNSNSNTNSNTNSNSNSNSNSSNDENIPDTIIPTENKDLIN